jgi:glycosyltransferase involved in cell wall biosynthesis
MKKQITIGLPFYNNQGTLEIAIKSILFQTFQNWELLLINDGSTDDSLNIAKKYAQLDNKIRLISDGENRGLVYRLNQIIELSKNEFVARMDADDIMHPDRLLKQIDVFEKDFTIDIVATAAYSINEKNMPISIRDNFPIIADRKKCLNNSLLIHPSILVKTQWYKKNNYNADYLRAEDFELWVRTISSTNFYRIQEPLLFYREGNVSLKNYKLTAKTRILIYKNYSKGVLTNVEMKKEIMLIKLKVLVYQIFSIFNLQFILTKLRGKSISSNNCEEAQKIIAQIENLYHTI